MEKKWNVLKSKAASRLIEAKQKLDESGYSEKLNSAISDGKKLLDESGVSEKFNSVSNNVSHQLDAISGQKILEKLEERIALQDQYNNILATKLEEALTRIEILEQKSNKSRESA